MAVPMFLFRGNYYPARNLFIFEGIAYPSWKHAKVVHEHNVWEGMRQRCRNATSKDYCSYGGRGITVCKRWNTSFETFIIDMGRRPGPSYTLERRNNGRGYSPSNCYWATPTQQARNKRRRIRYRICLLCGNSRQTQHAR